MLNREFKVVVIKILTGLEKGGGALWDLEKNQSETKNSVTEIRNVLHGINSRLKEAEWIHDREDGVMESNQAEQERKKIIKIENRLKELSNTIKHNNFHII